MTTGQITGLNNKKVRAVEVLIDVSESTTVSNAVDIGASKVVAIQMPSAWTAANIKFAAAAPGSTTYNTVIDANGADVTVTSPAASKCVALSYVGLEGLGRLQLVSTAGQAADRTITLILKDE